MAKDREIVERLERALRGEQYLGPIKDAHIDAAERELEISFPRSYRLFLLHFGAAKAAYEIAGLPDTRSTDPDTPYWSNVIDVTLQMRRATRGNVPFSYIPISGDGADFTFYLDTSKIDCGGECRVVVLGPGMDDVQIASTFVEFIEKAQAGELFPATA
jgi:antitoxin YobK